MRVDRKLTTGLSAGVLGLGVIFATASPAAAADLPALTVTPSPVGATETFEVRGTDCIANDTPGVATVTIIYPDGHDELAGSYNADKTGSWYAAYEPNDQGAVPTGTYTLKVTCDTYDGTLTYPDKQFNANESIVPPAASVSDDTITPGQQITVFAEGLQSGQHVDVYLYSDPVLLGSADSDLNGEASVSATVPTTTSLGAHTIVVVADDGTQVEIPVTVIAATPEPGPGTAPVNVTSPELANTGANAGGLGVLAGGLLLSGGAALYAGRRKRS